ncbi:hypothetical protein D3C77_597430 [compost metagenome]
MNYLFTRSNRWIRQNDIKSLFSDSSKQIAFQNSDIGYFIVISIFLCQLHCTTIYINHRHMSIFGELRRGKSNWAIATSNVQHLSAHSNLHRINKHPAAIVNGTFREYTSIAYKAKSLSAQSRVPYLPIMSSCRLTGIVVI